nr:coat protein [Rose virus B]
MTSSGQTVSGMGALNTGTIPAQGSVNAPLSTSENLGGQTAQLQRLPTRNNQRVTAPQSGFGLSDVDADVLTEPLNDVLEARFENLKQALIKMQSPNQYTNLGLEIGRPDLKPMDHLVPDQSSLFARPSIDMLAHRKVRPACNEVTTAEELLQIQMKLQALGVPEKSIATVAWDMGMYCTANSASPYMNPKGSIEVEGKAVARDLVGAVIKEHTTLRQFCRAYAPCIFQHMLLHETPPPNWQAKKFPEVAKYAAFDFFDYVMNPACIQPLEGLIRSPTKEEQIAYETYKRRCLNKRANNDRFASNDADITGGMFGCPINYNWRESNCK